MSTLVMSACWPLQIPPTPKAVLISLADNANDHGDCWPSQTKIAERTCLSERSVRNAIKWLEDAGYLVADRSNGRHTRYVVVPTPAADAAPARDATPARRAGGPRQEMPEPRQHVPEPRQEMPPNRKEPSRTVKATVSKRAPAMPCPDHVDPQTWADWLTLRKAKNAPVTETVVKSATREAQKAGMPLTRFLEIWCARGSQGLEADWLKPSERASTTPGATHAANPNSRQRGESLTAHAERINRQHDEREAGGQFLALGTDDAR